MRAIAFLVFAGLFVLSGLALMLLTVAEPRRRAPQIRDRANDVPGWVRNHVPESLPVVRQQRELTLMREELEQLRRAVEGGASESTESAGS